MFLSVFLFIVNVSPSASRFFSISPTSLSYSHLCVSNLPRVHLSVPSLPLNLVFLFLSSSSARRSEQLSSFGRLIIRCRKVWMWIICICCQALRRTEDGGTNCPDENLNWSRSSTSVTASCREVIYYSAPNHVVITTTESVFSFF